MTAPPPEHPATPTTPTTPGAPAAYAGRILALLTVANVLNFYDRAIPAVVVEPVRQEFGLTDSQVGVLSSAFIVVYAIAGVLLGRLADAGSRRKVMAAGLLLWSVFTALSGGAWSFASLLLFRLGVGIGEASYAPSANALIFDTWPTHRRARAVSIFQIALPVGLLLACLTVGPIVERTGSWRWPFVVAAVPGLGLAILLWFMPEPPHIGQVASERIAQPLRHLIRIRTLRWLILAGIGTQIANYAGATFLVPLLQRWFGMPLSRASLGAGLVLGAAGLLAYPTAGVLLDWAARHSLRRRLVVGATGATLAMPLAWLALLQPPGGSALFLAWLAAGWFTGAFMGVAVLAALSDVVPAALRATAVAVYLGATYLLGGSLGPLLAGGLSDRLSRSAREHPGPLPGGVAPEAVGLHASLLIIIPASFALAAVAAWLATRTITGDHDRLAAHTPGNNEAHARS